MENYDSISTVMHLLKQFLFHTDGSLWDDADTKKEFFTRHEKMEEPLHFLVKQ